jgi:hypothetical protein
MRAYQQLFAGLPAFALALFAFTAVVTRMLPTGPSCG